MAKGKKSLKATLSSQQSRLKKNVQVKEAAQAAEQRDRTRRVQADTKSKAKARPTIPFRETDRILLVGEGDFSFARALVLHPPAMLAHLPAVNVTATAYDVEEECYAKYPSAPSCVSKLREKGVTVLFGIDAMKLDKCAPLKGKRFDRVVWNFPHTGKGIADQDRNIRANQEILLGFLRTVPTVLAQGPVPRVARPRKHKSDGDSDDNYDCGASDKEQPDPDAGGTRGTVLVTLRNVTPYTEWDLPRLAKNPPAPEKSGVRTNPRYIQLRSFAFNRKDWLGYAHRMTKGDRAHGTGTTGKGGEDRTWEFCLRDEE
ncbi:hypothetical protein K488DRAFT_76813 [Vararia minispora EC-137]|uniref:Uncharacterized protein n=1 Tax=Vararia minispora EC-137 TaxID=1314806 RepID=A0ACB8QU56_9AGAM|nr:hypothetical protein K488DRAFT_76813 [Vararia minispora EC-137]